LTDITRNVRQQRSIPYDRRRGHHARRTPAGGEGSATTALADIT
jgi:hypothetical protein